MKSKERLLDNIGKLFFVIVALICIGVPSFEYYKIHNYPNRYTIGCVLGKSYMDDGGDYDKDYFYIVKGRVIKCSGSYETLNNKRFGDEIIVKYVLDDPETSDIVDSVELDKTCERPYISDSLKYSLYYSH